MIRVGIVGYGIIGQTHAEHFLEGRIKGAKLSAICNRGLDRRQVAAADLGEDSITNDTPLLSAGTEGINSLKLANAMYLSEWTDSVVELDSFDDALYYEKYLEQIEQENNS